MIISSTSGHACEDTQHKYPYMYDGHLLRLKFSQNVYELLTQTDGHGTLQATKTSGLPGDSVTLNPIPNDKYTFSGYQSTGCTIDGNTLTFGSQDCTAKATFYKEPELKLIGTVTSAIGKIGFDTVPTQTYRQYYITQNSSVTADRGTNGTLITRIGEPNADYSNWKPDASTIKLHFGISGNAGATSTATTAMTIKNLAKTYVDNFYKGHTTYRDQMAETTAAAGGFNLDNAIVEITAAGFVNTSAKSNAFYTSAYLNDKLYSLGQGGPGVIIGPDRVQPELQKLTLSGDAKDMAIIMGSPFSDYSTVNEISAWNGWWAGNLYIVE